MTALRILFVCGADLDSPAEKQALWFATELIERGHEAMLAMVGEPATLAGEAAIERDGMHVLWYGFNAGLVRGRDIEKVQEFRPDVIHARGPRLGVITATRAFARATTGAPFVHWLDDEWDTRLSATDASLGERARLLARRALARLRPQSWHFSTRRSLAWVTANAVAFDALTPALAQEVERRTGRDCAVILPASPVEAWEPRDNVARALPAETDGSEILLFTGDVHFAREADLRYCFAAIADVQRRGHRVSFVQAGRSSLGSDLRELATRAGMAPGTVHSLGTLPFSQIPPLLRRASILLEPGLPSPFNRLRLPSKLQAYLASGTPVITFGAGFGELLRDREEALLTRGSDPTELADAIVSVLEDDSLRRTLSERGPQAARRLFDPERNTEALLAHYREALERAGG